jgi:hypothetical protein
MNMRRLVLGSTCVSLVLAVVWAANVRSGSPAGEAAVPQERFRVTVDDILHEDSVSVTSVGIDTLPKSWVQVTSDLPKRGGAGVVTSAETAGPSHARVTFLTDHAEWKHGSANTLKFMMRVESGTGTSTLSDTGPMPEARRLADVYQVSIKPGVYPYGASLNLATYKDVTYSLIVKKPQ